MSKYYEIKADIEGKTETLFGSYDKEDCVFEKDSERDNWKEEGFKKIRIESREVDEKPDVEIYGNDINPVTGEIRTEDDEEFTEAEETALKDAIADGYNVEGGLARLYLDLEYANSFMLMVTHNMPMPFKDPSYKAAKAAYKAYWDAVDSLG
jgi:hypothetical protein